MCSLQKKIFIVPAAWEIIINMIEANRNNSYFLLTIKQKMDDL